MSRKVFRKVEILTPVRLRAPKSTLQSRIRDLEAALRPFAELPPKDAAGNPIDDLHVNYCGGAGWGMRIAGKMDPRKAVARAAKVMRDRAAIDAARGKP
jgi:hypothetical protein